MQSKRYGRQPVDVISLTITSVTVTSQPARVATTDSISAKLATDSIMDGLTALTPKFAVISGATIGNNTLVAAVTGKKIRVLQIVIISAGTVNVTIQSGAAGTALTGAMPLVANSGFVSGFSPIGHFETAASTLLNMSLSAAIQCSGWLVYVEV